MNVLFDFLESGLSPPVSPSTCFDNTKSAAFGRWHTFQLQSWERECDT
jgi:hypothetical protein